MKPVKALRGLPDPLFGKNEDPRADAWVPDRCDRESGEPLAPEVQIHVGHKAVPVVHQ